MDIMTLLIQLVSGALGGNVGGLLNKARSLGPMLNTVL
jgi:glycerol uptake facilitator-like aquaporin